MTIQAGSHRPSTLKKVSPAWWMALGSVGTVVACLIIYGAVTIVHHVSFATAAPTFGAQIPVTITFREAILSRGAVARINNYSERPLEHLTIVCSSAALNKSHQFEFPVLEAHHNLTIGWHEGWDFSPGDFMTVQSSGYAACSATVNK